MSDNILSWSAGSLLSVMTMITGVIRVDTAIEIAFYGFIGGVVGMLGKWLIQHIRAKFEKIFKN